MPGNLSDVVNKSIEANERMLKIGKQKSKNLETRELNMEMKFKKGLVYGAVISALLLCSYGGCKGLKAYNYSASKERAKVVYYQDRFDHIKHYYNSEDYVKADELSEKLQEDMGKEGFFSPTKDLYKRVKEYDDSFIDPEVKRVKREKFYQSVKNFPKNTASKIKEKWDNIPPGGRFIVYACGIGLIVYLLRKRN